ncbi:MAG: fumarylacetoacetate hydrolase family protein [Celeribacter sp.]|jgi:fumarylpyruvate hydrolase
MSQFAFPPAPQTGLPIEGEDALFPVRRVYCVGRNFAAHAIEMGHDPDREPPFFFAKPADAVVPGGADVAYPPRTEDLHYEGELVIALASGGRDMDAAQAESAIFGYAIGNDLTRRDMQAEAKSLRRPWDLSKGFEHSAVVGPIHRAQGSASVATGRITSHVNGTLRQEGDLSQMIWKVAEIISYLSGSITLAAGDLIFTGTPSGVGTLVRGDVVSVEIEGLGRIETPIV